LILVPSIIANDDSPELRTFHLATDSFLVSTKDGSLLRSSDRNQTYQSLAAILSRNDVRSDCRDIGRGETDVCKNTRHLLGDVAANNYPEFVNDLHKIDPNTEQRKELEYLFAQIARARTSSPVGSEVFQVPRRQTPEVLAGQPEAQIARAQTPLLTDDTKNSTSTVLYGMQGLNATDVESVLSIDGARNFPASSIKAGPQGDQLTVGFPSLTALKISKPEATHPRLTLYLMRDNELGELPQTLLSAQPCVYQKKADNSPSFKMIVRSKVVNAGVDGTANLQLTFAYPQATPTPVVGAPKPPPAKISLTVSGAEINVPASSMNSAGDISLSGTLPFTYTLQLANLNSLSPLTLTATDATDSTKSSSIEIPVLKPPPKYEALVAPGP
jgi:hypothetical protein